MKKGLTLLFILALSFGCKPPKALEIEIAKKNTTTTTPTPTVETACPSNFILVPANALFNTAEFCVGKFHAKNNGGNAVVTAAGVPWDSITGTDAQAKCEALSESGFTGSFSLISNPEWMTIARNLEGVTDNWSSGIVGTGQFVRGHSDGTPNNSLEVTDENDAYNGTSNLATDPAATGWNERRTFKLSNGKIIWDFAGNVWSWVDWISTDSGFSLAPTDSAGTYRELNVLDGSILAEDLQPAGAYTSTQGFGQWYGAGGGGGAAIRGGRWANTALAGIYSMYLADPASNASSHTGFRCVYRP